MPDSTTEHPWRPLPNPVAREAFTRSNNPRKILVYAPLALSTPHFETDLEIAQRHIDLGDEVDFVLCDGELPSCQMNPHHEPKSCVQCISRNLQGTFQLSRKPTIHGIFAHLLPEDIVELARLPVRFDSQEDLRRFRYAGFDAGMATLSSMIDFARSPEFDTVQYDGLVNRTLAAAVAAFLSMRRILAATHYDRVYIYNGRWSMLRSAVRACELSAVPYYTHERGSDFRKFALYKDVLPHDKEDLQKKAGAAWRLVSSDPRALSTARSFFEERRQRVERNWHSYTKNQEVGRVPADWHRQCRRIVCFSTSEYELAAIGEGFIGKIYATQIVGMKRLAAILAERSPSAHLWVRLHPNDDNPCSFKRWIDAASGLANVTLVLPVEKVDSYAMLDGAERVLTFGSTIGLEATYWGKPSVCADFSYYDSLDAQYEAADEEDLADLLCRGDLAPKARENALKFGYYLNTFGEDFIHFSTAEISDFEFRSPFRGRCLKPDYDDYKQRLLDTFKEGNLVRSQALSQLLIALNQCDVLAHSILILCHVRNGKLDAAMAALQSARRSLTAVQIEAVLRSAGPELMKCIADRSAGQGSKPGTLPSATASQMAAMAAAPC